MRHGKQAHKEATGTSSAANSRQPGYFDLRPEFFNLLLSAATELHVANLIVRKEDGNIDEAAATVSLRALCQLKKQLEEGVASFPAGSRLPDDALHMRLQEMIGDAADLTIINTSKNLILDSELRIFLRDAIAATFKQLNDLRAVLLELATRDLDVVMPAHTHSRLTSPVLLSNWWLVTESRLSNDYKRLREVAERVTLLSAGFGQNPDTEGFFNRAHLARYLDFDAPADGGFDDQSDRDYLIEYTTFATITSAHIAQLSQDIYVWSTSEYGFARLPRNLSLNGDPLTYSRQPEILERISSRSASISSRLIQLLTEQKGTTISHHPSLIDSAPSLFDVYQAIKFILESTTTLLPQIKFDTTRMAKLAGQDTLNASHAIDYLVDKDFSLDKAQKIVSSLVDYCKERNKSLPDLTLSEWANFSPAFSDDIYDFISTDGIAGSNATVEGYKLISARQSVENALRLLQADRQHLENLQAKRVNLQEFLFSNKGA